MEVQLNLNLPEDFSNLCTIYQIKPENILQALMDQVSFPCFYSQANGKERWATLFFLNYLDQEKAVCNVDEELEDQYLKTFTDTVKQVSAQHPTEELKTEQAGRKVMEKWMKATVAQRASYLTNGL